MTSAAFHLAQLNIARRKFPMDDSRMKDFIHQIETINAIAESDPGFVWRLVDNNIDPTYPMAFPEPDLLINLSVWKSTAALKEYVYRSDHAGVMRRRREWFDHLSEAYMVLWWIPAGHIPTLAEAREKLEHLRTNGATPKAFHFSALFEPGLSSENGL